MAHDENGIWAISKIIPRKKKTLVRFESPPKSPDNPFLPLPKRQPIDLLLWNMRRAGLYGLRHGLINEDDYNNEERLYKKYIQYLEMFDTKLLRFFKRDE